MFYRVEGNSLVKYCQVNDTLFKDLDEIPATPPTENAELVIAGNCHQRLDVLGFIEWDRHFSGFQSLIEAAGVTAADLEDRYPVTVFAPNNSVIEKMDKTVVESLMNDKPRLKNIVLNHMIPSIELRTRLREVDNGQ